MLEILSSSLTNTIVLLLENLDFTRYATIPDRGFICDFMVTIRWELEVSEIIISPLLDSCSCLFDGDQAQNAVSIRNLLANYTTIYHQLAAQVRTNT